MIDPKLNEVPAGAGLSADELAGDRKAAGENSSATERLRKISHGLSANDTISGATTMSVGGRGVDVSGVSAGAGAGAGFTKVNASQGTVNEIVPGERGAGTTAMADNNNTSPESVTQPSSGTGDTDITNEEISVRAYEVWCERGRPVGSPEVDWETAERELRNRKVRKVGA